MISEGGGDDDGVIAVHSPSLGASAREGRRHLDYIGLPLLGGAHHRPTMSLADSSPGF